MLIIVVLFITANEKQLIYFKILFWKIVEYIYKNIVLIFSQFPYQKFFFLFSIYKMVNIMDVCKSLNISIRTVIKNPEMLKICS